jgi:hypothetical protein
MGTAGQAWQASVFRAPSMLSNLWLTMGCVASHSHSSLPTHLSCCPHQKTQDHSLSQPWLCLWGLREATGIIVPWKLGGRQLALGGTPVERGRSRYCASCHRLVCVPPRRGLVWDHFCLHTVCNLGMQSAEKIFIIAWLSAEDNFNYSGISMDEEAL